MMTVLQKILNINSLNNTNFFNSLLKDHTVFFSVKLKNLQKTDASHINISNFFSFVFNEREMAKEKRTLLKNYLINQLLESNILVIETNILFYNIFIKVNDMRCVDYLLSLHFIYFLTKSSPHSSPKNLK